MAITRKIEAPPVWLLLVFSLGRRSASLRVSVWRKLQSYGVVPLGNSGYLLPASADNRERFEWLAQTIRTGGGEASVAEVNAIDNCPTAQLKERFREARSRDYQELLQELRAAPRSARRGATRLTRLRHRFQNIVAIDFFGSPLRDQVERLLKEPSPPSPNGETASRREYQKKVWVTRPRPGVDRVTSAWLIRKFIDPKARFAFAPEAEKPSGAVPFDMYEGGFGHRGEDCTFETLIKAFRIRDKRLAVMAQMVHDADLFDEKFGRKEGFGIDAVMKGWARQGFRDSELLARGMQLAEGLYASLG